LATAKPKSYLLCRIFVECQFTSAIPGPAPMPKMSKTDCD